MGKECLKKKIGKEIIKIEECYLFGHFVII